jgi:hypothetical protein
VPTNLEALNYFHHRPERILKKKGNVFQRKNQEKDKEEIVYFFIHVHQENSSYVVETLAVGYFHVHLSKGHKNIPQHSLSVVLISKDRKKERKNFDFN